MQSKRSFFNATLLKKNLSRSWPLWGGVTAMGCLVPLYLLLRLISDSFLTVDPQAFTTMLYGAAVYFVPAFSLGYAILVAMVVWSYLYNARSVGLMHTLPIDRPALFLTNTLSGLAMLLIPYAVVGGLLCVIAAAWGFFDLVAVANTVLAVLLMTVMFFGLATFCAMVTGNIFGLPVFYLLLNFLAPALDWLVSLLAQSFLVGVTSDYSGALDFLSPVVQIYQSFRYDCVYVDNRYSYCTLQGVGVVALYGLVGLILLGLALALYLRRKSECAGDVVAFKWLRPVFRYGVALLSALTMGQLIYAAIWESLFQQSRYADLVPMIVSMAIAGLVGYYAASMLLEKSLRVFRRSWPGAVTVFAVASLLCFCVSADLFGVESRVPELSEIDTVTLGGFDCFDSSITLDAETEEELTERVRALHSVIVDHADELRAEDRRGYALSYDDSGEKESTYEWIFIDYTLKDGTRLRRNYDLILSRDKWEAGEGYEGALRQLAEDEDLLLQTVSVPSGAEFSDVYLYNYRSGTYSGEGELEMDDKAVYEALLRDAREGNLARNPFSANYYDTFPVSISVEYRTWERSPDEGFSYSSRDMDLRPTMTNTIQALLDQGFITPAELEQWRSELSDPGAYELPQPAAAEIIG